MSQPKDPKAIGTGGVPDAAWLARQPAEPILEPDLPIVDAHHHLWDRPKHRYMLEELLADTGSGHRVVATVFVDCRAFYRAGGPEALRPLGETEFANGVAAMGASGVYGSTLACAAIVSHVDLLLGAAAREPLEAHISAGNGRFRGIRHAGGWVSFITGVGAVTLRAQLNSGNILQAHLRAVFVYAQNNFFEFGSGFQL